MQVRLVMKTELLDFFGIGWCRPKLVFISHRFKIMDRIERSEKEESYEMILILFGILLKLNINCILQLICLNDMSKLFQVV